MQPDGYFEASQDAVHLVGADHKVHRSQAFITCQPLLSRGPEGPVLALHCTLRVKPFEVVSEFQSFKHVEVYPSNELQEAVTALEHQVGLCCMGGYICIGRCVCMGGFVDVYCPQQGIPIIMTLPPLVHQAILEPTLVLTNALPYALRLDIWELPEEALTRHLQHRFDGSPVVPMASLYAAIGYKPTATKAPLEGLLKGRRRSIVRSASLQEGGVGVGMGGGGEGRRYEVYVRPGGTAVCGGGGCAWHQ